MFKFIYLLLSLNLFKFIYLLLFLETTCPPPFVNVTSGSINYGCYHFVDLPMDWCLAREHCYTLGADLANPDQTSPDALEKIRDQVVGKLQ